MNSTLSLYVVVRRKKNIVVPFRNGHEKYKNVKCCIMWHCYSCFSKMLVSCIDDMIYKKQNSKQLRYAISTLRRENIIRCRFFYKAECFAYAPSIRQSVLIRYYIVRVARIRKISVKRRLQTCKRFLGKIRKIILNVSNLF